jgi:hypothetical protein
MSRHATVDCHGEMNSPTQQIHKSSSGATNLTADCPPPKPEERRCCRGADKQISFMSSDGPEYPYAGGDGRYPDGLQTRFL